VRDRNNWQISMWCHCILCRVTKIVLRRLNTPPCRWYAAWFWTKNYFEIYGNFFNVVKWFNIDDGQNGISGNWFNIQRLRINDLRKISDCCRILLCGTHNILRYLLVGIKHCGSHYITNSKIRPIKAPSFFSKITTESPLQERFAKNKSETKKPTSNYYGRIFPL